MASAAVKSDVATGLLTNGVEMFMSYYLRLYRIQPWSANSKHADFAIQKLTARASPVEYDRP
jgi:hypothetical protein